MGARFGERFFIHPDIAQPLIAEWALPAAPWRFTDDTQMALSVVAILETYGGIEQDALAHSFAKEYEGARGDGPAIQSFLPRLREGKPGQEGAPSLFSGQ